MSVISRITHTEVYILESLILNNLKFSNVYVYFNSFLYFMFFLF